ncbi:AMP-binding protein [Streptomyces sp. NPDC101150]|uniref:AMP-binding protein n=1 Tax=Streptomyces sp. NPDC101150 TaxID=3366114 RepID=UPI003803C577
MTNRAMEETFESLRPDPATAARYRAEGWWRDETFLDDLRRAAAQVPERPAIVNWRSAEGRAVIVTFGELAERVDGFAAGLWGLGVRREVVAFQLPDWWETVALTLACWRIGAVGMPLALRFGPGEVARRLAATGAGVYVTVDTFQGTGYAAGVARLADELPALRHRVVIGDAAATGALNFDECLRGDGRVPPEAVSLEPDDAAMVVFSSGTTGTAKGVVHSANTVYAAVSRPRPVAAPGSSGRPVPVLTPLNHGVGLRNVLRSVMGRTTALCADVWDAGQWLDLLSEYQAGPFGAPRARLQDLAEEQRRRPRALPAWEAVCSFAAQPSRHLVRLVREELAKRVLNAWGSSESPACACTSVDDPPDWAAHSMGRPRPGVELRLSPAPDHHLPESREPQVSTVEVRSPSNCLGSFARDSGRLTWRPADTDGWYATGDLVRPDGRGGLAYVGRAADRISGVTSHMVPVHDVEEELRDHPAVAEAVLVGYPDAQHGELPCAVIVPADGQVPDVDELRGHLAGRGMAEWCWPTRAEVLAELPRNDLGKVRKDLLRSWLIGEHPLPGSTPAAAERAARRS